MGEWFSVQAVARRESGRVVLSGEAGQGVISLSEADVRETGEGVEVRVDAPAVLLEAPPRRRPTEEEVSGVGAVNCDPYRTTCVMLGRSGILYCCSTMKVLGACHSSWSYC